MKNSKIILIVLALILFLCVLSFGLILLITYLLSPENSLPFNKTKSCTFNGAEYKHGETFKNDCNTCSCNNGEAACTLMGCLDDNTINDESENEEFTNNHKNFSIYYPDIELKTYEDSYIKFKYPENIHVKVNSGFNKNSTTLTEEVWNVSFYTSESDQYPFIVFAQEVGYPSELDQYVWDSNNPNTLKSTKIFHKNTYDSEFPIVNSPILYPITNFKDKELYLLEFTVTMEDMFGMYINKYHLAYKTNEGVYKTITDLGYDSPEFKSLISDADNSRRAMIIINHGQLRENGMTENHKLIVDVLSNYINTVEIKN